MSCYLIDKSTKEALMSFFFLFLIEYREMVSYSVNNELKMKIIVLKNK